MKKHLLLTGICVLFFACEITKAQSSIWATTLWGGAYNGGTIFSMNSNGTGFNTEFSFQPPDGYTPFGNLLQASNGKLYGTCYNGGSFASCTIFKYDPVTGNYIDVYDFDIIHGDFPLSGVLEAPNGKLYGAASSGGAHYNGVIYSLDLATDVYTDEYDLQSGTGGHPVGCPLLVGNTLYGLNEWGGVYSKGVIYSFNILTNTYTNLFDFDGALGAYGKGSLVLHPNGKLYGMTSEGGVNDLGVIFSYDPATDIYTKLLDFDGTNGSNPEGSLLLSPSGAFYGMTKTGGTANNGVLFSFSVSNNSLTVWHHFNGSDGSGPIGDLAIADNKLCGTTRFGGSGNVGVIFNYSLATNIYTKVFDFNATTGSSPAGGFISVTFTTGIPGMANTANGISVYPNPVNDLLKVHLNSVENKNVLLNLRDIFGKTIYSSSGKINFSDQFTVDMKSCCSGLYFLEVIADGHLTTTKVMKE